MFPQRFRIIRPYLASFIHYNNFQRPPAREVLRWLCQPGREARGAKYVLRKEIDGEFIAVYFVGHPDTPFYYPRQFAWIHLCGTADECFNPKHWHHYLANGMALDKNDVVLDCGAADGLFTFVAAPQVKKIFAIEPVPAWHSGLEKTFARFHNVEIVKTAVAHKKSEMKMTDNGLYSGIRAEGQLTIPVETIDNLFFAKGQRVTFIKMDIEGYEFQALLGAENTIRKNRPRLSLTLYHPTNHYTEIRDYLEQIHQDYQFKTRGIADNGNPALLQVF